MKKMSLIAIFSSLILASAAHANSMKSLQFSGAGCPKDHASVAIAPGGQTATIIFDNFVAAPSSGTKPYLDCWVTLSLADSSGINLSVDMRGYTALEQEGQAIQHSNIVGANGSSLVTPFEGPLSEDYLTRSEGFVIPRRKTVKVNLAVAIESTGQITVDSADFKLN